LSGGIKNILSLKGQPIVPRLPSYKHSVPNGTEKRDKKISRRDRMVIEQKFKTTMSR